MSVWCEWVPKGQHGHRQQFHTHEKPLGLLRQLVKYATDEGDTVCDPLMGSGTAGVVCAQVGRAFVGIEIDEAHYATAQRRIAEAQGKGEGMLFRQQEIP